ncbi:hypothetical protein HDV57DRAFT_461832 [Trichoderma longibrachiatum]|uniref:BZIP domain-containing protein n=1 Tax=Trichoderma longibrachiatum ATCC 18648 TaxID=983965 RepID=A0A2T4C5C9_TRILO|nr:hypothetical protein M440DRAFT_1438509 [Trichoderma longibrachiatum ATCC 18648]
MDSHNAMASLIDPQLQMMGPGTTAMDMPQYPLPTSFDTWSSLFEPMDFAPPAQDMGVMGTDLRSDSASSVSPYRKADHELGSPLSPLGDILSLDGSPGGTSISAGPSESGTRSTDDNTPKTAKAKGTRRRCRSEAEKRDVIKQRNRVAASKCRQKKKEKVDELKEMKSSLERRNSELQLEYQRLRQELGQVKSHLIRHTDCNDPNIDRWVENEAKSYVQKLVHKSEQRRLSSVASISSADGVAGGLRTHSVASVQSTAMTSEDPYMGLG